MIRDTKHGQVKGFKKDDICMWFGIPYAKPPVDGLRFKRAREMDDWKGFYNCTKFSSKCWQFGGGKFQKLCDSDTHASENCLYLNIWSKDNFRKKPVFVWIHGGGQYCGEASDPAYDLKNFAKDGIVGVSFNYRLGPLGFYDFSKYGSEFESNCAISDMLMALKWIYENIETFGGDPENITLCGESAGGTCTMALLGSPIARKYFKRAIIMSGVLFNITGKQIQEYNNRVFFEQSGIDEAHVKKLMTADYEVLRKGSKCRFEGLYKDKPGMLTSGPVLDDLIPLTPLESAAQGLLKDKEIMIGTCRDEAGLFNYMKLNFTNWTTALEALHINGYSERVFDFTNLYDPGPSGSDSEKAALTQFGTDIKFWAGSVRLADALSEHGRVYSYRFDYSTPVSRMLKMGATHTMDITAAFDNKGTTLYKFALDDGKVKNNLHKSFVNFISTGNPNFDNGAAWPSYNKKERSTMIFNTDMKLALSPRKEFCKLWEGIELY